MIALGLTLLALSIWLYQDAQARQMQSPVAWVLLLWLSGPIALAWYWSRRPLFVGEYRVGGSAWIILRAFLVAVTAYAALLSAVLLVWMNGFMSAGAIIMLMFSVGLVLSSVWLAAIALLLLVAWLLRNPRRYEAGPSHPALEGVPAPVWGDRLLKVIFFAGLFAVFVFTEPSHPKWMETVDWQAQPSLRL